MVFKTNYNQQRAERNRAKQAKKDEKQRERDNEVARRKNASTLAGTAEPSDAEPSNEGGATPGALDGTV